MARGVERGEGGGAVSLAFWPTVITTAGVTLGVLHLTARWQCRRKGHRWQKEDRNAQFNGRDGNGYAPRHWVPRCRRCRQWADS